MKSILLVCFCLLLTAECATKFDFFKLAEQWPGSLHLSSDRNFRGVCSPDYPIPDKNKFFIHGFWPANAGKTQPNKCPPPNPFKESKLARIMDKLEETWPSYVCAERSSTFSDNIKFWGNEWSKHGTCSNLDQFPYFNQAWMLHIAYDPFRCLKSKDIIPSDSEDHALSKIQTAFQECFRYDGHTPVIKCLEDPKTKSSYLWELEICFKKSSYEITACPPSSSNNKCNPRVFLPPFK